MKNGMLASSRPNLKGLSIAIQQTELPVASRWTHMNILNGRDTNRSLWWRRSSI
ncbi:hypothetical protein ACQJBY_010284 [Aegilops geniculata]